jgi:hypothetical protein
LSRSQFRAGMDAQYPRPARRKGHGHKHGMS